MSQHPTLGITLENSQLIEDHQLVVPVCIYRLQAKAISHTRFYSWFMLVVWSVFFLITLFSWHTFLALSAQPSSDMQQEQLSTAHFLLVESLGMGGCVFLVWLFLVLVRLPSMKKMQVIVCENGLLQIRGRLCGSPVDVIRWGEIQSLVPKPYPILISISFRDKERKPLDVRADYDNSDALLAQIKQYSHIQERKDASKAGSLIYFQGNFLIDRLLQLEHRRYLLRFSQNQRVSWLEERVESISIRCV